MTSSGWCATPWSARLCRITTFTTSYMCVLCVMCSRGRQINLCISVRGFFL